MRASLALCLGGALAALGTTAAQADRQIGVVVTGEPTLQPQLAAGLETWLRHHGFGLVPSPLPPDAINTVIDCFAIEDEGCAKAAVAQHAIASTVVYARVELTDSSATGDRTVAITAYWYEKGGRSAAEKRTCTDCTDAKLRTTADEIIGALAGVAPGSGHLAITSRPTGASVTIDGAPSGATPLEVDLPVGPHRLELATAAGMRGTRTVTVADGSQPIEIELATPMEARTSLPRAVPLGMIGVGATALLTGIVLVAVDEDAKDVPVTQRTFRNTAAFGTGLAIGGVVVGAIGAVLFVTQNRHRADASGPVASATATGAVVGWSGRF